MMLRRSLLFIAVAAACCAPSAATEHKSWNKIRYVGGTVPSSANPYDWNTTLTVTENPGSIQLVIAPAKLFASLQTLKLKPAQVISLSYGMAAWRLVQQLSGTHLPSKPPALFGLFDEHGFFAIVYKAEDGKRGAVLLESYFSWRILNVLEAITGKLVEHSP